MPGFLEQIDVLTGIAAVDAPFPQTHDLDREVVELFDELRDRMLRYVLGFGLTMPRCEEIVQEAFLALFLHLRKGRSRRNLRSWLFRVAHNLALKSVQTDRREVRHLAECRHAAFGSVTNPEDEFSRNQTHRRLQSVYQALPERSQRCLSLRSEGFTYREIAEILDISLGAVAIALARSLARMAEAEKRSL
jgi:RNA polymerase sigma-70 factor, ECF subfamily